MARGSIMLQLEVEQTFSELVSSIPLINRSVFDILDGDRVVVREIAVEKIGGLSANVRSVIETSSDTAFARLDLAGIGQHPKVLYAPSHVDSPHFSGMQLVVLTARDVGIANADLVLRGSRRIAVHAYIDETA